MTAISCTCGFTPDQTCELADHFGDMFTPDDDIGPDGQVHLELTAGLKCSCGFTAIITDELDKHFHSVFPPPAGQIGRDGRQHETREAG
jgi:hypothetical protein